MSDAINDNNKKFLDSFRATSHLKSKSHLPLQSPSHGPPKIPRLALDALDGIPTRPDIEEKDVEENDLDLDFND